MRSCAGVPPQSFLSCICLFVGSLIKYFTRLFHQSTVNPKPNIASNSQLLFFFFPPLSFTPFPFVGLNILHSHFTILLSLTYKSYNNKSLSRLLRKQPTGFVLFFTFLLLLFWFSLAAGGTCARHVARSERSLVSSHEGHHRTFLGSNCEDGRVWRFFESAVNSGGKCGGGPPSIGARFGGGSLIGSGCFSARSPLLVWFCSSCSTITARIGSNSPFW